MAPRGGQKRKAPKVAKTAEPAAKAPKDVAAAGGEGDAPASEASAWVQKPAGQRPAPEFQAPDVAEVLEIASTQNLYKSNLFRLQLEEMLKELTPKATHARLESCLRDLKGVLESLKSRSVPGNFAKEFGHIRFHEEQPFPLEFTAPSRIDVVGSYLLGTGSPGHPIADVALEMPEDVLRSKDYINFRYFDKRNAYLGEVQRQLQAVLSSKSAPAGLTGVRVEVEALHGDSFRPCLVLRGAAAEEQDGGPWAVRLFPVWAGAAFQVDKLTADRNSVRSVGEAVPTPHYNSCLLEDARMRHHVEMLHAALGKYSALKQSILLLRRWAAAKGLLLQKSDNQACTTMSGFCLATVAAHAALTSNCAPARTSYFQLFKLALTVLGTTDWATHKVVFGKGGSKPLAAAESTNCRAHFLDADGTYNFFWRLGPFMSEVAAHAQRCLKILDTQPDPYDAVFGLEAHSPTLVWDLAVRTPPLGAAALCPAGGGKADSVLVGAGPPADLPQAHAIAIHLTEVLKEALSDRCVRASPRIVMGPEGVSVVVGLVLDASNLDRVLDKGPSAESTVAAKRFRNLWGKSELRRFKDGSVLECVAWKKPEPGREVESRKQPSVVTQIVKHLLERHFPTIAARCDIIAGPTGIVANIGERERRLWQAFEAFRSHLCQLSSLPLTIKDVHAVDASFSYTCVSAANAPASDDGVFRTLHNIVVEFESSGKWPDDPDAIRKVGAAMLLQMREELGGDLGLEAEVTEDFIDVRFPEFVFRVNIFNGKELMGVAQNVTSFEAARGAKAQPTEQALERLRTLWWRPRMRATLHGAVLQAPAMAGASRLVQRWLRSQLLGGYEEFVDHLVLYVFLQPSPFETPTSPQVALNRVLWLLDTFDWERDPLIVDIDGKLTSEERLAMRQSFEHGKQEGGAHSAFWIASRYDPHSALLRTPPATMSAWLRKRARHALSVVDRRLTGALGNEGWAALFSVDHSAFDLVVRLKPAPAKESLVSLKRAERAKAAADQDAVKLLVERIYAQLSPVCLVFHDDGGRVLALRWRPSAFLPQSRDFLMGAVPHTMVAQEGDKAGQPLCVPNVLLLTTMVASLAEGLALDIAVVR